MSILDKHAPFKPHVYRLSRCHRQCPWSTPALRHLVHLRHVPHHRLLKSPTNISARTTFCHLRRHCTKLSRTLKKAYFKAQCHVYYRNPRPLWNTINLLTGRLHAQAPPQASIDDLSNFFHFLWLLMLIGRLNLGSRGSQHQPPITCLTVFNLSLDRVQHQTLINDLSAVGVRGSALKWFISYLTDRQQQVRCGISIISPTACSRGVPQGGLLGPALVFTLHQMHPRNPARINQVPTFC